MHEDYEVDSPVLTFNLDKIPVDTIHPLSDAWDYMPCPVCERIFYRIGSDKHIATHRYREPWWLRALRWLAR
jgi:hypothetical protein